MKVLFSNVSIRGNFGFPCIVMSIEKLMKDMDSSFVSDYDITVNKNEKEYELQSRDRYGLNTKDFSKITGKKLFLKALLKASKIRFFGKSKNGDRLEKQITDLSEYDAVIDLYGIIYTDKLKKKRSKRILNIIFPFLFVNRLWLLAKILKIPVIKNTTAIGPCRKLDNKFNALINLGFLCDRVIARDEISRDICHQLGLKNKCMISPDTAFCTPVKENRKFSTKENELEGEYIGFGVSHQIAWRFKDEDYCSLVSKLLNRLVEHYGFKVVLIPNEFNVRYKDNDVAFANKIREIMVRDYNRKIYVFESEDFTADQIKGFISTCSAVITARYHTMVASLSTATPVFAMSWHHKYRTALKMFECEKYVVEHENFDEDRIYNEFIEFYDSREQVGKKIDSNLESVRNRVSDVVAEVVKYIEERNKWKQ